MHEQMCCFANLIQSLDDSNKKKPGESRLTAKKKKSTSKILFSNVVRVVAPPLMTSLMDFGLRNSLQEIRVI